MPFPSNWIVLVRVLRSNSSTIGRDSCSSAALNLSTESLYRPFVIFIPTSWFIGTCTCAFPDAFVLAVWTIPFGSVITISASSMAFPCASETLIVRAAFAGITIPKASHESEPIMATRIISAMGNVGTPLSSNASTRE